MIIKAQLCLNKLCLILLVFYAAGVSLVTAQTKVYIIPSLHGIHRNKPLYFYNSLRSIINSLHPDIIGVEIRAENRARDTNYLKLSYPYEMRQIKYWFPEIKIVGFD